MSRHTARLRVLETKLRPGECRACLGRAWDMVRVEGDDPVPPAALCEACGKPRRQFIIHFVDNDADELPGGLQPRPVDYRECLRPMTPEPAPEDITPRPVVNSKPRAKRRRWYGPE
jgi:fermentation-respiration switch protein FrsA (DUF1100 family)